MSQRRVHWAAALPAVATLVMACASGKGAPGGFDGAGWEGGIADAGLRDTSGRDAYVWPDRGQPDTMQIDAYTWDKGAEDLGPPDLGEPDSGPVACPDSHEPNQSCTAARNLGSTKEGSSWKSRTGTLSPSSDIDWFRAEGEEGSHTCLPFTNQKYYFKVRLTVPTGRVLRVCVRRGGCSGSLVCADNASSPTTTQLNVQYKVSGTCAFNDDTTAYFKVESIDGQGACDPYTIAFNYDD